MLKCIIVDDQHQAVQSLKNFIKKVPFLDFIASFADSKSAHEYLKNNPADLIFLDIKRSLQTGSNSIFIFKHNALVILTAASRKFALDGFDHEAVDFLIKPVQYERFYMAVEKAYKLKSPKNHTKLIL